MSGFVCLANVLKIAWGRVAKSWVLKYVQDVAIGLPTTRKYKKVIRNQTFVFFICLLIISRLEILLETQKLSQIHRPIKVLNHQAD